MMKIEYDENTCIVKVDGKDITELSTDEKKNVLLRIASYIRTQCDEGKAWLLSRFMAMMCGNDNLEVEI